MDTVQICVKIDASADEHLRSWAGRGEGGKFCGLGRLISRLVLAEATRLETRRDERVRLAKELLQTEESVGV